MSIVIETTKGVFTVDLYIEQRPKGKFKFWCIIVRDSVGPGSEFPVPGQFRVLQSRVRAGYGYTLKFETRVPGTLQVIGG